ncbi:hypothetical protein, partial [Enterobacter intestinihominis]
MLIRDCPTADITCDKLYLLHIVNLIKFFSPRGLGSATFTPSPKPSPRGEREEALLLVKQSQNFFNAGGIG